MTPTPKPAPRPAAMARPLRIETPRGRFWTLDGAAVSAITHGLREAALSASAPGVRLTPRQRGLLDLAAWLDREAADLPGRLASNGDPVPMACGPVPVLSEALGDGLATLPTFRLAARLASAVAEVADPEGCASLYFRAGPAASDRVAFGGLAAILGPMGAIAVSDKRQARAFKARETALAAMAPGLCPPGCPCLGLRDH